MTSLLSVSKGKEMVKFLAFLSTNPRRSILTSCFTLSVLFAHAASWPYLFATVPDFILALDQGTTSSRAILFNRSGQIHAVAQKEFQQIFPRPGWVEHDPSEIWTSQLEVARDVLAKSKLTTKDVAALGITNQRET